MRFNEYVKRVFLWRLNNLLLLFLTLANTALTFLLGRRVVKGSVLHVSYMVHIPWHTVELLRKRGVNAKYLAVGTSPYWNKCDYNFIPSSSPFPVIRRLEEIRFFWGVVSRFQILHLHFMTTFTETGWELAAMRRMGRKIVIHYRGCEIRDWEKNMKLHPDCNICQDCDYGRRVCGGALNESRRRLAREFGDYFMVTTPDMLEFAPNAVHFPFFAPEGLPPEAVPSERGGKRAFKIVHATCHPGIEGTARIQECAENLKRRGYDIDFVFLKGVSHSEVLKAMEGADLSIGKMKMGYYANAQIESMAMGIPTITYVRPEFMTDALRRSGFIFSTLDGLEETMSYYIDHPDELEAKRRIARVSILSLHDNDRLARELAGIYEKLCGGTTHV